MSLFADYIKERMGASIVERDEGFATYRFIEHQNRPAVYIEDIYVRPEAREKGVASEMADDVVSIALKAGCTRLIGTVNSKAKNPTASIKTLLAYGFEFFSCNEDGLVFKKEI